MQKANGSFEFTHKHVHELILYSTREAYSLDRYGVTAWDLNIRNLMTYTVPFTPTQIAAIMNSKWTRWALDRANDRVTPTTVRDWIDHTYDVSNPEKRAKLLNDIKELV